MVSNWTRLIFSCVNTRKRRRITYETLERLGPSVNTRIAGAMVREYADLYPITGVVSVVDRDLEALAKQGLIRETRVSSDRYIDERIFYEVVR